jgi:hypothetical protein
LEYNRTVHQLFVDIKKAYDSVRREVFYSILIKFGIPLKLVRPTKMFSKKPIVNLLYIFLIQHGLKQEDALSPLLFSFALE